MHATEVVNNLLYLTSRRCLSHHIDDWRGNTHTHRCTHTHTHQVQKKSRKKDSVTLTADRDESRPSPQQSHKHTHTAVGKLLATHTHTARCCRSSPLQLTLLSCTAVIKSFLFNRNWTEPLSKHFSDYNTILEALLNSSCLSLSASISGSPALSTRKLSVPLLCQRLPSKHITSLHIHPSLQRRERQAGTKEERGRDWWKSGLYPSNTPLVSLWALQSGTCLWMQADHSNL